MIDNFKVIVSGYVFNEQGELLVIKRADNEETFPGMYAVPGGTVEVAASTGLSQNTIEDNLKREIKEETDVDVEVGAWIESSVIAKSDRAKLYLFFTCKVSGNSVPAISDETPEVMWIAPTEIDQELCTPSLKTYVESLL